MTYRHSTLLVFILYFLLAVLPLLTLVLGHFAIEHAILGQRVLSGIFALFAVVVLLATLTGLRWQKFIRASVQTSENHLDVTLGGRCLHYPWSEIAQVKDNALLQLLRIYNQQGQLILVVDHLLLNYSEFKHYLDNKISAQKVS